MRPIVPGCGGVGGGVCTSGAGSTFEPCFNPAIPNMAKLRAADKAAIAASKGNSTVGVYRYLCGGIVMNPLPPVVDDIPIAFTPGGGGGAIIACSPMIAGQAGGATLVPAQNAKPVLTCAAKVHCMASQVEGSIPTCATGTVAGLPDTHAITVICAGKGIAQPPSACRYIRGANGGVTIAPPPPPMQINPWLILAGAILIGVVFFHARAQV